MPKKEKKKSNPNPHIRWTKSQVQRLKEAVDAYNKNVRRVKRLKGYKDLAPQTEKFKELKEQIGTAKELNRITRLLNKFASIKGRPKVYTNPHGVEMLQWRREKIRSDERAENKRRKDNRERLSRSVVYDYNGNAIPNATREQMLNENRPINAKPETIKSVRTLIDLEKNLRRMAYLANPVVQLERLKDNMKKAIFKVLGEQAVSYYENAIEQMQVSNFESFYLENEGLFDDFFNYESERVAEIKAVKANGEPLTYEDIFKNRLKTMFKKYRHME